MSESKILLVDDEPNILDGYRRELRHRFPLETALSGIDALKILQEKGPFAVVISDLHMDDMTGIELLIKVKQISPDSIRIMLTGAGFESAVSAVNEGHIFRFLTKPCAADDLAKAITDGLAQRQLMMTERQLISKTLTGAVRVMTDLLALVKPCAFGRAARIRTLARKLAEQIAPDRAWKVEIAAMLSQIGCAALPDELLIKAYSNKALKPNEQQAFDDHPRRGKELIGNVPRLEEIATIIGYQAKLFDGRGIPEDGVAGESIPVEARILKLAIDFDSLQSNQVSMANALVELQGRKGWYDPSAIQGLKRVMAAEAARQILHTSDDVPNSAVAHAAP